MPREFPALNRLIRLYLWMAAVGGGLMAVGLGLGLFLQAWGFAGALLSGGLIGLAGGLWGRQRARRLIDRLRDQRTA